MNQARIRFAQQPAENDVSFMARASDRIIAKPGTFESARLKIEMARKKLRFDKRDCRRDFKGCAWLNRVCRASGSPAPGPTGNKPLEILIEKFRSLNGQS